MEVDPQTSEWCMFELTSGAAMWFNRNHLQSFKRESQATILIQYQVGQYSVKATVKEMLDWLHRGCS